MGVSGRRPRRSNDSRRIVGHTGNSGQQRTGGGTADVTREDLVELARRGDREAFGQLAAGEVDRLYAIARLVLRDPYLAEDAVQEALVRCWRQLPKLRDVERFDGWLYRILVRAAVDEVQRRRRFEAGVETMTMEPSIGDSTSQRADRDQLEHGFRRLSIDHRAIVVLHQYVGLPMPEAAAALGIPVGTAKSRYHYAMTALRAALEADERQDRLGASA
jgi:RNA polymerase sigma-70 factor (ECF subfamily)